MDMHLEQCPYSMTECRYCQSSFTRMGLQNHLTGCEFARTQSAGRQMSFSPQKMPLIPSEGSRTKPISGPPPPTSMKVDQLKHRRPNAAEKKAFAMIQADYVDSNSLRKRNPCSICLDILVTPLQASCVGQCLSAIYGACKSCFGKVFGDCGVTTKDDAYGDEENMEFFPRLSFNKRNTTPGYFEYCESKNRFYPRYKKTPPKVQAHTRNCDFASTRCAECGKSFNTREMLLAHQRISEACLTEAGRCFYYERCGYETDSIQALRKHLQEAKTVHIEYLTLKMAELSQTSTKWDESKKQKVTQLINEKIALLKRHSDKISMEVVRFKHKLAASNMNSESLESAMKMVDTTSKSMEGVTARIENIKDSGPDRVTLIESHAQYIKRNSDLLNELEKRVRNLEVASFDGTMIWKIKDYKRKKSDAIRGRQISIYSQPFYSSRTGYKMCLRAYINGDGLGRGKCLSLFFVVMRGEYDELLQFPFQQRVTFTLLAPHNPSLNKEETFLPDPDSSSFRRPQTEMNIASGYPQFVPHSTVESSNYLINDCIYIRVAVAPGGDNIP